MVKAGGIVVLDNAERMGYNTAKAHLMAHCEPYTSITAYTNSGKLVVTEFYRMKGGTGWI
jgi:predicted O-methyltransferase YrrM